MSILQYAMITTAVDKRSLSDEEIIAQILTAKKQSLLGILYNRYATKIYRKCMSFVKEQSIAEDLTHDVFVKISLNLASFKGNAKFSTWVYAVTYNYCIDYLRVNKKIKMQSEKYANELVLDEEIETAEDLRFIKIERLISLLNDLRPEDKMILIMKYKDGLTIKEIMHIFKISESAVKMRVKRAKERIKRLYNEKYTNLITA